MDYPKFLTYNIAGGLLWAFALGLAGFFFGNLPIIQQNLSVVVYGVIAVSLIPQSLHQLCRNNLTEAENHVDIKEYFCNGAGTIFDPSIVKEFIPLI